jgi:hypothetical protein
MAIDVKTVDDKMGVLRFLDNVAFSVQPEIDTADRNGIV